MQTGISDTNSKAEEFLYSLMRNAGAAEKMSRIRSLSESIILLSRRAIRRANPDFSDQEVNNAFVELHYGEELAGKLLEYLRNRDDET